MFTSRNSIGQEKEQSAPYVFLFSTEIAVQIVKIVE